MGLSQGPVLVKIICHLKGGAEDEEKKSEETRAVWGRVKSYLSLLTCVSLLCPSLSDLRKTPTSHACLQSSALHYFIQYLLRSQAWVFFCLFFKSYYRNECIHGCLVSSSIQLLFQQAAVISSPRMLHVHERKLKRTHNSTTVQLLHSASFLLYSEQFQRLFYFIITLLNSLFKLLLHMFKENTLVYRSKSFGMETLLNMISAQIIKKTVRRVFWFVDVYLFLVIKFILNTKR